MGAVYGLSIALSRTAPPGFSIAGDEMTVGGIVLLVLGLPMAIGFVTALGPRAPRAAVAFPEAVAVVVLVVEVVVLLRVVPELLARVIMVELELRQHNIIPVVVAEALVPLVAMVALLRPVLVVSDYNTL